MERQRLPWDSIHHEKNCFNFFLLMQSFFSKISNAPILIRLSVFILILLCLWLPIAAPIYYWGTDPNWVSILTMLVLYVEFIILVKWWGKRIYEQPRILKSYGLEFTRQNLQGWLQGLIVGCFSLITLFSVEAALGFLTWDPAPPNFLILILEGFLIALGVSFAEELLFRGWLWDELRRDYSPGIAFWSNTLIFALLHFIKPLSEIIRTWPQFPGLVILGMILLWAKQSYQGRLGLPIGIHGGLVWAYYGINVGQLVQYSSSVPEWITGVDQNPLAGVMGLIWLSLLGFWLYQQISRKKI